MCTQTLGPSRVYSPHPATEDPTRLSHTGAQSQPGWFFHPVLRNRITLALFVFEAGVGGKVDVLFQPSPSAPAVSNVKE